MLTRYKNTYGDGTVDFVEIEIPDSEPNPMDEELSDSEALDIILGGGEE